MVGRASLARVWAAGMFAVLLLACALPLRAGHASDEACDREQCLIVDFLTKRNNRAGNLEEAISIFGKFLGGEKYGGVTSQGDSCGYVPLTQCFSRVITLRQKIYLSSERKERIGCLVVGGISKEDRLYRSFGVVYLSSVHGWEPVGIDYYQSLNDAPTQSDLLTDPCPPRSVEGG